MNWNEVAAVFAKEAGLPKALRDPATRKRIAEQLTSPSRASRFGSASAVRRFEAHATGQAAKKPMSQSLAASQAYNTLLDKAPTESAMLRNLRTKRDATGDQALALIQAGGQAREQGRRLQEATPSRLRMPSRSPEPLADESMEAYLRRYYGRPAETPTAAGGASPPGGGRGSGGGGTGSGGSPSASGGHAGRNIALALAGAALLGGGAYLWRRKRDREEAETPPEQRWSTAGAAR